MTKKKTIQMTLTVETAMQNYEICSKLQETLEQSPFNNSEYKLCIEETKVVGDEDVCQT